MRQKSLPGAKTGQPVPAPSRENVETLLRIEPLAVEVGLGLVRFVEGAQNSPLLRRIASIRRQLATELGYILPPVRVTDNLQLKAREYVILLKGVELSHYELPNGMELAIHSGPNPPPMPGTVAQDPAFGVPAVWITPDTSARARAAGYTVVDAISVLGTHLGEIARRHAHELFSRQDAKKVLDRVNEENSKAVEDLVPKLLSLAAVQKVLQNLLRERVSIRDAATILEALGEAAPITRNTVLLTEYVRQAIRRAIVSSHTTPQGELAAYMVEPSAEHAVEAAVEHSEHNSVLGLAPQSARDLVGRITRKLERPDSSAVVLVNPSIRYFIKQLLETAFPDVTVLSHSEIPPEIKVKSLGWVG
jgi:flagellar biosynthesis protein FlhA